VAIGSVPSLIVGVGAGAAASAAFEPALERPKQDAWAAAPNRLPDVGLIAALVAGGKVSLTDGQNMAARLGFDKGPFDSLTWLAQDRLNFPLMLRMWRLAAVNPNFDEAGLSKLLDETLAHEQLDWNYQPYLRALRHAELPGIGDLAYSVVRGYLPTNITLPVAPPSKSDYVPRFPQSQTLAEDLAKAIGYDQAMLELMVARSGLSMAPVMAANALFRSDAADAINNLPNIQGVSPFTGKPYVGPNDYLLAISEGDLRTEWAHAVRETAKQLLTAGEYAELELRGWIDKPTRRALTQQHGMSDFDSDLRFRLARRPLTPHQVKQALARGAKFNPEPGEIKDPYTAAVHQASLGPEWYEMGVALQASYPSLFITNRLVTNGIIDATTGADWIRKSGEADEVVTAMEKSWSSTTSVATVDPHVKKAQTSLWTESHKAYVKTGLSRAQIGPAFSALAIPAAAQQEIFTLWDLEKQLAADVPPGG
jgi:hypothetical protein